MLSVPFVGKDMNVLDHDLPSLSHLRVSKRTEGELSRLDEAVFSSAVLAYSLLEMSLIIVFALFLLLPRPSGKTSHDDSSDLSTKEGSS